MATSNGSEPLVAVTGLIHCSIYEGEALDASDKNQLSDPYVVATIGKHRLHKTECVAKALNPVWDEHFEYTIVDADKGKDEDYLLFTIKDRDRILGFIPNKPDVLGYVKIPIGDLATASDGCIEGWFNVQKKLDEPVGNDAPHGKLRLKVHLAQESDGGHEVPGMYFNMHNSNRVTLYQDAHHDDGDLPIITRPDGQQYVHGKCWEDVMAAIEGAKHFIYICGWSIYVNTRLVRDANGEGITFGELIKKKAAEGVKICFLLWNEKTSNNNKFIKSAGVMNTFDEETRIYFDEVENVKVKLAARYGSMGTKTQLFFTHHQKTICFDTEAPNNKRRISAFIGGLDVTLGRFDTPKHPLFRSLQTANKDDFYNSRPATAEMGPRQPWHDIHSRIEGPGARDVLNNFLERWRKQAQKYMRDLCSVSTIPLISEEQEAAPYAADAERWATQVFRSIDSNSMAFSFRRRVSAHIHDPRKRGHQVEVLAEIQKAYVYNIRRAKKFVYIENQYFFGGCKFWDSFQDSGCENRIPVELVSKIVQKILNGEQFAAYILVPLYPEGQPEDAANQEILHWQYRTMEMMYKKIANAIATKGIDAHPRDYLNFFCLGVRETTEGSQQVEAVKTAMANGGKLDKTSLSKVDKSLSKIDTWAVNVNSSRRFMAYVHSKMMIVDDEYIIVGSANINQRSMAGDRDTEIAVGMWQEGHVIDESTSALPTGQIHAFRRSLWAEHLGGSVDSVFLEPHTLDCVKSVREKAEQNLAAYLADEVCDIPGHLMQYPLAVSQDGKVEVMPECPNVPDTNASIIGAAGAMPDILTT